MRIIFFIIGLFMILATPVATILILARGTQLDTLAQGMLWLLGVIGLLSGCVIIYIGKQSDDPSLN